MPIKFLKVDEKVLGERPVKAAGFQVGDPRVVDDEARVSDAFPCIAIHQ
jgi:hypothetical protein